MKYLRNYFFWTYERGSIHFDIMVTLILLFLFVSPRFIDFKDKPIPTFPLNHTDVLVQEQLNSDNEETFLYEVRVADLHGATTDDEIQTALLNIIQPISGEVTLQKYTPVRDAKGNIVAYDATVIR